MKRTLALGLVALLAVCTWLVAQENVKPMPAGGEAPPMRPDLPPGVPAGGGVPGMQPPGIGPGVPMVPMADHRKLVVSLIENLDDADGDIRQSVATALARIGRQSVPPLTVLLEDKGKSLALRANAAYILGQIGTPAGEALPALTRALREKDAGLRKRAAYAIAQIVEDEQLAILNGGAAGVVVGPNGFPVARGKLPADPGLVLPPAPKDRK